MGGVRDNSGQGLNIVIINSKLLNFLLCKNIFNLKIIHSHLFTWVQTFSFFHLKLLLLQTIINDCKFHVLTRHPRSNREDFKK